MFPDYYKLFDLSPNSSKEEIKKRYRELVKKYHPDVNKKPDATSKMQEIQEAYFILYDEEARSRYNIQYEKIYGNNDSRYESNKSSFGGQTHNEGSKQKTFEFDDPILERWILNAQKQAFYFVKNTYKDATGIAASGCAYYFKALGVCILIFVFIIFIIRACKTFT